MNKKWLVAAVAILAIAGIAVVAMEISRRNVPDINETAIPATGAPDAPDLSDPAFAPPDPMNREAGGDPAQAPADPAKRPLSPGPEAASDEIDFPSHLLEDESGSAVAEDGDADAVGSDKILMENYDQIYEDNEL